MEEGQTSIADSPSVWGGGGGEEQPNQWPLCSPHQGMSSPVHEFREACSIHDAPSKDGQPAWQSRGLLFQWRGVWWEAEEH